MGANIGFGSYVDGFSSVDGKALSDKACGALLRTCGQGIMSGYASDGTEDCMPFTHSMATRLGKTWTDVHKSGCRYAAGDL